MEADRLESPDHEETLGHREIQGQLDRKDYRGPLEILAPLGCKVTQVSREELGLQGP